MQQKVQFITALIHEPELLILDEPWSGLDPINADVLREIVLEQREAGRTIMFSTHLMEQAEQIVDSVCIIARGRKVLDGSLAEIRRDAARDRCVTVGFADDDSLARAETTVLADAALVASHRELGKRREVELVEGRGPDELLKALVQADTRVTRFEKVEPTLHKIFVDRVGEDAAEGRRAEEALRA
jgi:ABC-2 type transport system ATP-binding protein